MKKVAKICLLIGTLTFLVLAVIAGTIKVRNIMKFVKSPAEIKEYVIDNTEMITTFSQTLYENQEEQIEMYRKSEELPDSVKGMINPFDDLRVIYISIQKGTHENGDRVFFLLEDKPDDKSYYNCGFYYSPNDTITDLYGNVEEGDYFEHDGGPTGERSRYRSEKICDNWYYFEEALW